MTISLAKSLRQNLDEVGLVCSIEISFLRIRLQEVMRQKRATADILARRQYSDGSFIENLSKKQDMILKLTNQDQRAM